MNKKCINATAHYQNILHGDTFYNIKREIIMAWAEMPFVSHLQQKSHDFFMEFVIFVLFAKPPLTVNFEV